MKQSKEVKGTVLCENFNEKFCELLKNNCKPEITKCFYKLNYYLDIFLSCDIKLNCFADEGCGVYGLTFCVDKRYRYRFTFYTYICSVHLSIYDFNDKILSPYTFAFDGQSVSSFFNSIQTEEENASELEQPEEDAEEPEEVVKSILNIEPLSPLERTVFEAIEDCFKRYNEYAELAKVAEYGAEYNGESAEEIVRYGHLANEQIFNSDYLKELISKAGLDETYQAWLKERREREHNKSSDIEAEENDI